MLGRRGSFRGSQPCLERRGSTSSLAASDGFLGRRRGSISSSAGALQAAAGGRRGSLASSVANSGSSCPVEGKRGCASSNITVALSNVKGGGGTLAMIALPIPAPRVRKVPIKLEREAPAEEVEDQGEGEDMGAGKEKEEAGGGWKFRTGLSPGKWSTRSLRRSKEEMVAPLQRRNSLRGSFRIGRRGEEEENEQKDGGKKKPEGVGVKKKERRPLADLNKAEKERNPIAEKDRNAQSVEKERREVTKKEEKKGEKELRKPLADLLQSGGRRTSISGPHQQVRTQRVELKLGATRPGLGARGGGGGFKSGGSGGFQGGGGGSKSGGGGGFQGLGGGSQAPQPHHQRPRQPDDASDPPQLANSGDTKSQPEQKRPRASISRQGSGTIRPSLSRAVVGRRESEGGLQAPSQGGLQAPALLRTIQPPVAKDTAKEAVKEVVGALRRVGSTGQLGRQGGGNNQLGGNNQQGAKRQDSTSNHQQPNFLSSFSRSLSTLPALPAYFRPPEPAPTPVLLSLSVSDLESSPEPPQRPPRLSSSSSSSLSSLPSSSSTSPTFSLLPHPASCVGILKTPGRRKMNTKHVDFMENIAEREFIRDCDITDSDIRDI